MEKVIWGKRRGHKWRALSAFEFFDHTGYQFASLLFSLIFVDNLVRWIEGRGDSNWFWLCSGKLETLVLFGVLSLVAHFLYWSGIVAVVNEQRPGG